MEIEETKRKVKLITEGIKKSDWDGVENSLLDVVIEVHKSHKELAESTPRNSDIALLIQEMRHGFESMDKRFDDLIHQMDKRFERVDNRFSTIQWFMGIGFSFIAIILTYGTFFR